MGTTSRLSLRYPNLTDAPNGPQSFQFLAEDTETWLTRAYPCLSSARPSSPADGLLIRETDTAKIKVWNATASSWDEVGSASGGGGGTVGEAIEGEWSAASNQTLSNATETLIAFGTTVTSSSVVTRATSGVGHKFTLAEDGCYAVTCAVRYNSGTAGSRFLALRNSAQSQQYVTDQNDGGPSAATRGFSITKRFTAGTELVVVGSQSSGGSLATVAIGVSPAVPYTKLIIVKVTD